MKTFLIAFALALASSAWSPPADGTQLEPAPELHADPMQDLAAATFELDELGRIAEPAPRALAGAAPTEVDRPAAEPALDHHRLHPTERRDDDPIHHLLEIGTRVEHLAALDRHWRPATNVDDRPRRHAPRRRLE